MARPLLDEQTHLLRGTRRTQAVEKESAFIGGKPRMPKDLSEVAQTEWKRLVKELARRGTLSRADSSALEVYCRMWARWRAYDAEAEARPMIDTSWLDKNGVEHTKTIVNPAAKEAARLDGQLRQLLKEFSATPASRERTKPAKADPNKKTPVEPGRENYEGKGIVFEEES